MNILSHPAWRVTLTTLALVITSVPFAYAEDGFVCPLEDEKECAYENESLSLFIKGRDAYDHGREIGDLSEAREIGYQLAARKNKNMNKIDQDEINM